MQFENRPPELQIFSIEGSIENLMKEYEMAVRNKQFERAQEIVEEINNLDKQKIEIQQGTKTNQIQNIKSILNAGTLGMTPGKDMGGRPIRMEADMVKKSQEEMGDLSKFGMKDGGEASFPDLNNDGETTYADVLVGRGVYAEGDEVIQNMYLEKPDYRDNIDFSRDMKPGTPEDYEKKIYLLEKEIASQFKEYHGAVEGGFEEQAAAKLQEIQQMMAQRLQLKNEYTNQFNSNKVKGMAEGGEAIDDELAGMQMSEEDAMAEVGSAQEEMQMIQQLVVVVQQLLAEGISEEDLVAFLKEQGLDEEDINSLMQMVMQQMQQGQEDPIASELQEMS